MDRRLIKQIAETIRQADRHKTHAYDTAATVVRVEGGIAWVHIPGGVDETPVKLTVDAKQGDMVQVRVGGGRAFLVGNATAPPTDDTTANKVGTSLTATQKVVKAVKATADKAVRIATSTAQYFWVSTGGTDNGAHVTAIPQSEFEADPQNGGGNTLLTSNGVAVRDGLTELATFSAGGSRIGADGEAYVETDANGINFGDADGVHMRMDAYGDTFAMSGRKAVYVNSTDTKAASSQDSSQTSTYNTTTITRGDVMHQAVLHAYAKDDPNDSSEQYAEASLSAYSTDGNTDTGCTFAIKAGGGTAKATLNDMPLIVKQTYSATGISASTYYHVHTFDIAKAGYTPIAVNVRLNQAAIYCSSIDYTSQLAATVSVAHRTNNSISNLNLYLEVTYARNELL
ncbi:MAG: hypothetical protein IJP92_08415 [Lachnospiraceae bacterium]|nr:hypothetical protein [Lachnospiraceae bacterium]